jgi:hypothetical protein
MSGMIGDSGKMEPSQVFRLCSQLYMTTGTDDSFPIDEQLTSWTVFVSFKIVTASLSFLYSVFFTDPFARVHGTKKQRIASKSRLNE